MMMWWHLTKTGETRMHMVLLVIGWLVVAPAQANNLHVEDPIVLRPPSGQTGMHFGFSLAHYTNNTQRWLLVGAPWSNASNPNAMHSGGLYRCQLTKYSGPHECIEVNVETIRENTTHCPSWAKDHTDKGFGFSLASDGETTIMVCEHQWYIVRTKYNEKNQLPAGRCFAARAPDYKFKGFSPPFINQSAPTMSYLTTGFCQFGMSAAYLKGQNKFAFGAPGCWTWKGDTWEVGTGLSESDTRYIGKQYAQPDKSEPKWKIYGRYMGYSVASLRFGNKNAIVSSIPRTAKDDPKEKFGPTILILIQKPNDEKTLEVEYKITPTKVTADDIRFAFFGYSLATLDLNGDGLEDLVVGAPFYNGSSDHYDQGAIFIYMQTASKNQATGNVYQMKEEDNAPQRVGRESFGRFGSCVAAIGDLDGDGYEDLAVGAPYLAVISGKSEATGEVYIYMGSQKGLDKNIRQTIKATANQFGFGSSIAQQLPSIEGQGYDVAVGAYNSDAVLIFKSKEVVDIVWNLDFSGPIDVYNNSCICESIESRCPCVDLNFCLKYQKKIMKDINNKKADFTVILKTENDKLFFESGKNELQKNFEVQEGQNYCEKFNIQLKPNIEEIKSFSVTGNVSLGKEEKKVILDRHSGTIKSEDLDIIIQCSSGDIQGCQSDIILEYEILDKYVLMSQQPMKIRFKVKNQGETAYESRLRISSEDEFIIHGSGDTGVTCELIVTKDTDCEIGRLNNNFEMDFTLSLTPAAEFFNSLDTHTAFFNLTAKVETYSTLSNPETAITNILAPIIVEESLELSKQQSDPPVVYFNSSAKYKSPNEVTSDEQLGPEIKHEYKILNRNKFSIYEAELTVQWPLTIDGKYFLYLLEELSFSGMSHNCEYPIDVVDPLNLKANRQTQGNQSYKEGSSALSKRINVYSSEYKNITCFLGEISGNYEITISLRYRLVLSTLFELELWTAVKTVSSIVHMQITKMPVDYTLPKPSMSSISTTIFYQEISSEKKVPVWLYIVPTLGGLVLLGIIVLIMWKCGFFKRKRIDTQDNANENQEEQLAKGEEEEEEEEVDHDDVKTPTSPMLKETENAAEDFDFHRP